MLEHQKLVLQGVSHNPEFFKKELIKSFHWLSAYEQVVLIDWVYDNYYSIYSEIIDHVLDVYVHTESEQFH